MGLFGYIAWLGRGDFLAIRNALFYCFRLEEAFTHYMQDWVARMKDIKNYLDSKPEAAEDKSPDDVQKEIEH